MSMTTNGFMICTRRVTARIVAALERGVAPWVRPWSTVTEALPMNARTRRPYRGVNFTLLSLEARRHGYPRNRWLTYRQALETGRPGAQGRRRARPVVFWQLRKVAATAEAFPARDPADLPEQVYPAAARLSPCSTSPRSTGCARGAALATPPAWEPEAQGGGAAPDVGGDLRHGGSKAFYRPDTDEIQLPPRGRSRPPAAYYNVALHELTHWTSHESRCNRQLGQRFGDDAYAAEELIAEMGAAFLCAHCRIDGELRHASYLGSWLKVLRADKRAIFVAATKAQQAADYLLRLAQPTRRAGARRLSCNPSSAHRAPPPCGALHF